MSPGQIWKKLINKKYRHAFVDANIKNRVAFQIRALRAKRGWSQGALAERLGTSQAAVSRLEDPSYGRYSLLTLLSIADTFDVALSVKYCGFSELVRETEKLEPDRLAVPSFEEDSPKSSLEISRNSLIAYTVTHKLATSSMPIMKMRNLDEHPPMISSNNLLRTGAGWSLNECALGDGLGSRREARA